MRDSDPTAVMRMEHQQIKQLLQAIFETVEESDPSERVNALVEVLTAHNQKEESILYPWLEQTLPEGESLALLDRIRKSGAGTSKEKC